MPRPAQPSAPIDDFFSRLAVHRHGRVVFIKARDVELIEAAGNYVSIRAGGGR